MTDKRGKCCWGSIVGGQNLILMVRGWATEQSWASEGTFPAPKEKEVVAVVHCCNGLLDLTRLDAGSCPSCSGTTSL